MAGFIESPDAESAPVQSEDQTMAGMIALARAFLAEPDTLKGCSDPDCMKPDCRQKWQIHAAAKKLVDRADGLKGKVS